MRGSDFVRNLTDNATSAREDLILRTVMRGEYIPIEWCPVSVSSSEDGACATIFVSSDALRVGELGDSVRINVTYRGAQTLADFLGVALPTTKISDLVHQHAGRVIGPCTFVPDVHMSSSSTMKKHSGRIDSLLGDFSGLVSTVGKDWVLTERLVDHPDRAANYGWHTVSSRFRSPCGIPILQPLGLAHNVYHVDYSQVFRPVSKWLRVDLGTGEEWMLLDDILGFERLAHLVSYEGVLSITRHPGVKREFHTDPAKPVVVP